jgi:hypothetical protein
MVCMSKWMDILCQLKMMQIRQYDYLNVTIKAHLYCHSNSGLLSSSPISEDQAVIKDKDNLTYISHMLFSNK